MKRKIVKLFLMLGVITLSIVGVACSTNKNVEIVDANDIEKVTISTNIYSSINISFDNEEEIETFINILNADKEKVNKTIEYSLDDVKYIIDVFYKDKSISIKVFLDKNIYYVVDNSFYICAEDNHLLFSDFIYKKLSSIYPDIKTDYIPK